jgi:hypothetical protein
MGMYTQVCGILNVISIGYDQPHGFDDVSKAVDTACLEAGDYWSSEQVRKRFTVLNGGNRSVFIAIACEGKIFGYSKDFELVIYKLMELLPSLEGRIEWVIEEKDFDIVWKIHKGECIIEQMPCYRNGYGNGI